MNKKNLIAKRRSAYKDVEEAKSFCELSQKQLPQYKYDSDQLPLRLKKKK